MKNAASDKVLDGKPVKTPINWFVLTLVVAVVAVVSLNVVNYIISL